MQRNATQRHAPPPQDNSGQPHTLTAAQAYALAKGRGWKGNQAEFIGWARSHPDGLEDSFGLKMADRYTFVDIASPPPAPAKPKRKPPSLPAGVISLKDAYALALAQGATEPSANAWRMAVDRHPKRLTELGLVKVFRGYQVLGD